MHIEINEIDGLDDNGYMVFEKENIIKINNNNIDNLGNNDGNEETKKE